MEITQQDWIAYEEVRTNPIIKLTGQVLFGRVLGLPKEKLEWIRNHYCELSKKFKMEKWEHSLSLPMLKRCSSCQERR